MERRTKLNLQKRDCLLGLFQNLDDVIGGNIIHLTDSQNVHNKFYLLETAQNVLYAGICKVSPNLENTDNF